MESISRCRHTRPQSLGRLSKALALFAARTPKAEARLKLKLTVNLDRIRRVRLVGR